MIDRLPHRPPFVFIDAIQSVEPGVSAVCEKSFPADDPLFVGHFPGEPLVPGVLLTEALAQTCGLVVGDGSRMLLSSIRKMNFPSAARPGESIRLHATSTGQMAPHFMFEVTASVDGRTVAEGQIVLSKV